MVKLPLRSARRGFTLVELLVVLAITALLLTIALPRYFGAIDKSRYTVLKENLRAIRSSIDKFYADRGAYPESLDELVEGRYLSMVPWDPIADSDRQWILVPPPGDERGRVADVKSGAAGTGPDGKPYESL
ncbi:type II secretion system protein [Roseateles cellulosilyticus]|uniref:Type II secretion system GspH family protein n=1 Tax=Pelomonas cellulosilytica TaxID=2906762 RepID=A0ABS8XNC3_9BURK|nr:prepilin-type N-terminal cleavage/methylation domain-containing protein [Pelomonas sp. P8]MCE4554276.1 type II secretion system GspH family protein [Pelomonas sp. P8]